MSPYTSTCAVYVLLCTVNGMYIYYTTYCSMLYCLRNAIYSDVINITLHQITIDIHV